MPVIDKTEATSQGELGRQMNSAKENIGSERQDVITSGWESSWCQIASNTISTNLESLWTAATRELLSRLLKLISHHCSVNFSNGRVEATVAT
jgi:hypothetical protein